MKYYHLTTPQQNIWNLQKYYGNTAIANLCGAIFFQEKRSCGLLREAVARFIQSQSGIRLRFCEMDDGPRQYVSEEPLEAAPVMTFASRAEFDLYAEKFAREPIGLLERKMYRFVVFHLEEEGRSGVLVTLSHLISDAWTFGLMANQIDALYRQLTGEEARLLTGDYVDFIQSEELYGISDAYKKDKGYWEETYAVQPQKSPVKLRLGASENVAAKRIARTLPLDLEEKIAAYCKAHPVTPAVLFETALAVYLFRINGDTQSVTMGVPVLNRSNAREREIAGMFVSTMPLTVEMTEDGEILELARRITRGHRELFRHQKYPYGEILRFLREKQDLTGSLYDVMVSYQNARTKTGADTKWYSNGASEVPLLLHVDNRDGQASHTLNVDYQTAVFDKAEAEYLIDRLEYILTQITAEEAKLVREVEIVPEREYDRLVHEFNDTHVEHPEEKCVHELFVEQAGKTPDEIALVFEDEKFTYRQLDEMSNSLAHFLREKGVRPNEAVPVVARRSWHVVVAMLGVLKAGGAYMLVDPDYPLERIKAMTEIAQSRLALQYGSGNVQNLETFDLETFDFRENIQRLDNLNQPKDLCYIVFTSGSTGTPKGIAVRHSNVVNYIDKNARNVCCGMIKEDCKSIVSVTNPVFDIFVTESLLALCNQLTVYLANEREALRQEHLGSLIEKYKIDVLQTTPAKMRSFLLDKEQTGYLCHLKTILLGGEAFPPDLYRELRNSTDASIYNVYGPAEATVWSSGTEIKKDCITIGKPISNTQIYILGQDKRLMPLGAAGELCISGEGVSCGYLQRPELTAERFLPNPFSTEENGHGHMLYCTGDLARWRADGEIEYLGRMDTQVKIRGLRIELGEIESVMAGFPGIDLPAAAAKCDEDGLQYLTGYYTGDSGLDVVELRRFLLGKLPNYMVLNYFVYLNAMPMTPSGKIDRKHLPNPDFSIQKNEFIALETETEKTLARMWERLLHVERVGKRDDFFALGGDSLLAIHLFHEIENAFHRELTVKELMEHASLEELAKYLEHMESMDTRIPAVHREKYILLPQQKAIYAVYRKDPQTLTYNMPARIALPAWVDRDRLKKCVCLVLERHMALKSRVVEEDNEIFGVCEKQAEFIFEEYREGEEQAFIRPFVLEKAPLVHLGFTEHALLFDVHHIVADGTSLSILLGEIAAAYDGKELSETGIWYSDYAEHFYQKDLTKHREYFKGLLGTCDPEPVFLPETKDRKTGGAFKIFSISQNVFAKAKEFARIYGLTDTMVFLGAYGILLSKYTAKEEILSSVILQNRSYTDIWDIVGMFVNTIPVYLTIKGTTQEYLHQIRELTGNLFQYQELPLGEIADAADIKDKSVINTAFVYQGDWEKKLVIGGKTLEIEFLDTKTAKFDFCMEITPSSQGCLLRMEYNTGKYDEALMDRLADSYMAILSQLDKELVADICVLSETEYHQVTEGFNDTFVDYPRNQCVHELFSQQTQTTPEKTALVFEDRKFTYRQLDEMSNSLAHFLREKGVRPNEVVPVIAKRSWHVIVAMLGVLKAGGAYMLIDYQYPEERIRYLVRECNAKIALTYGCSFENSLDLTTVCNYEKINLLENVNVLNDIFCVIHTSGSTGVPKVATLTHTNIVNYIAHATNFFDGTRHVVSTTMIIFDAFIQETIVALCNGIPLILLNEDEISIQSKFERQIMKYSNIFLFQTPTKLLNYLKNQDSECFLQHIQKLVLGGEVFSENLYKRIREQNENCNVINIYGPTETTICSTMKNLGKSYDASIGRPIANTQIYILDQNSRPLPIGVPGELCIAGEGVGKGYLNRPELTAERFVKNPFATEKNRHGKVLYHTGDLARWREDGEIEYLGRIDTQVKIRGLRIEPGEIESVMAEFPGIALTAAADKRDAKNRQYLAGYYTAEGEIDEKELRRYLAEKLPRYMVPNYFMRLEKMPMTPSGKTDRKRLPVPDITKHETNYISPKTDTEKRLANIWAEILQINGVSCNENFFDLGGDSLLAIAVLNRIDTEFCVEIKMRDFLEQENLRDMACLIDCGKKPEQKIYARKENSYKLLPQQKAIYAEYCKDPDTLLYNIPVNIKLPSEINKNRLKKCLQILVKVHPSLRTYITVKDDEVYGICEETVELCFEEYEKETEYRFVRPFILNRAPLLHVGFTEDALLLDIHHIISDGESINILLRELGKLYIGEDIGKEEVTYMDYARYFWNADFSENRAYFKQMLASEFDPVNLCVGMKGNPEKEGASREYRFSTEALERSNSFMAENNLTDTMFFLGIYGILLSNYTGKQNVLTSIVLSNRLHREAANVVGMFVNTLPVILSVKGSIRQYFESIKKAVLNLYEYQELPFSEATDAAGVQDKTIINTAFIYQGEEKNLTLGNADCIFEYVDTHTSKFDLTLEITSDDLGSRLRLEYNAARYDKALMDRLADSYMAILSQLDKEHVADICVLSESEYYQVTEGFNDTFVDYPRNQCVHELFSQQAQKTPEKTALVFEDRKFTYRQLDEMSNSLAHFLREKGVRPNEVVPVIAKRSWHVIVAMLGVLKAGGAYMLIDPGFPVDRIEYMIKIAESRLALGYGFGKNLKINQVTLENFDFEKNKEFLHNVNSPKDLCYVIFTSGSTGKPKGVAICHSNVVNYSSNNNNNNNVCHKIIKNGYQRIVSVTNIIFDIFVTESILPLLNGMTVYFADDEEAIQQSRLGTLIEKYEVEVIQTTPTKMKSYILDKEHMGYLKSLKTIILGGEALLPDLYKQLTRYTDAAIYNIYGPAETTVWSTNARVIDFDITIGRPIANTQIYILDQNSRPLPISVPGELCIAGEGVGKGYLNRLELTAERFVKNPFATEKNRHGKVLYHTGDLARWREDGEIEYLGRIDTQVKIRGLRIELGEIESVMAEFPGITLTAAADKRDEENRQYLTGYYTAEGEIDEKELRRYLAEKLPRYMVPNYFMRLEEMPMTPSGKTDRRNLPLPDFSVGTCEYLAPKTTIEKTLCGLLEDLFQMERIGLLEDFFFLGGDSLRAIEYVAKAHHAGIVFSLQNVFDYPTVQMLCDHLEHKDLEQKTCYQSTDFDCYQSLLGRNVIDPSFEPAKKGLGNVLLTGATGFLGAHVLDCLMREETGRIYCLVRENKGEDSRSRLLKILQYYFGNAYDLEFDKRIFPIAGDVELSQVAERLPKDVRTVIHTAASVKHYGSYAYFHQINVEGTRHIADYAKKTGAKMIHISTLSVSGNDMADDMAVYRSEEEKFFGETDLFIGQPLENVYIRSKFEAERVIYDAMLEGLDAKVIRVGNLTNRSVDFRFQPNYRQNAFLTRMKAMLEFGMFPEYLMPLYSEFSPVDLTAKGIVRIAQYADRQCVFHLYNSRHLRFSRFAEILGQLDISMRIVDGDDFYKALQQTIQNPNTEYIFEAFQNDLDQKGRLVYDSNIRIENDFTLWFLEKLHFSWNEIDLEYIKGYLEYFRDMGYLKV